jgi:hypothetical protein
MNGKASYIPNRFFSAGFIISSKSLFFSKVHQEFGKLFAMKVMIFAQELISVALTPFVLWLSLPPCAPPIIDFYFHRHGNVKVRSDS